MSYHDDDDHLGRGTEAIPLIEHTGTNADSHDEFIDVHQDRSRARGLPYPKTLGDPESLILTWCPANLPSILTAATFLLVFTTVVSTVLSFTSALASSDTASTSVLRVVDVRTLRRPSLYLGLERVPEIESNGLTFGSSYKSDMGDGSESMHMGGSPSAEMKSLARVSSLYPDRTFKQDGWVFITESDHTIFNFTLPPGTGSGAECTFHASFPSRSAIAQSDTLLTLEHDASPPPPSNSSPSDDQPNTTTTRIVLTALRGDSLTSMEGLTWATRPPASDRPLGSLTAEFGSVSHTKAFPCPEKGGWMIVEAACVGRGCRVEYEYLSSVGGGEVIGIELRRVRMKDQNYY